METKTVKTEHKKTSRGQRKHMRRVKQEARKNSMPENPTNKKMQPSEVSKQ